MTLFDIAYDDFKREDTTNVIAITLYTDDKQPITPNASHTWKAKVSKEDKYVGEYPVTIFGNTIKLSSSNLTRLPNGDYGLELWETYSGSTTIYPSAGMMEFRVHRNANDTLGTVDPTTDINGIIDDLHKAGQNIKVVATNTLSPGSKASVTQSITNGENQLTFNIPQGDKGDKGDVGPAPTLKIGTVTKLNPDQAPTASFSGGNGSYTLNIGIPQGVQGETNATATNALAVANSVDSKVIAIQTNGGGRNLLRNSNVELHGKAYDFAYPPLTVDYLEPGETYTMSWYGKVDANATKHKQDLVAYVFNGNWSFAASSIIPYTTNEYQRNVFTFTVPSNATNVNVIAFCLKHYNDDNSQSQHDKDDDAGIGYVNNYMLEKGTVAHDYQPAPEDVDNYASGRTITLPNKSSITVKDDRIIPRISLPTYITDNLPSIYFNAIGTFGEYDNLFVPSDTMATLGNRPINPDTNGYLTGDCFFSNHFAYSGAILRVFQKIYSCDYNYVFIRSYNGSSNSWSDWSCLARHA